MEPLESRRLLAVIINEFLASNVDGITDQDGSHSDWVELKNTGAAPVNVGGWYLTDDSLSLTKWQFPSTSIAAGGYLLVFASSKDRAAVGQELHTNFKLANEGGFLALVQSDGSTIESSFNPYPEQHDDVSYGTAVTTASSSSQTLVGASSNLKVISPTGENASVDDHWTEIGFSDAGWLTGTRSVGFDRLGEGTVGGFIGRVLADNAAEMPTTSNARFTAYVRYAFSLADKEQLTALSLQLRFDDGFIAYINGKEVKRVNFGEDFVRPQPQWDSRAGTMFGSSTNLGAINRGGEAGVPVTFDLTPYMSELKNGANVLAFHAVNSASTGDPSGKDFLLEPVLTAMRATGASGTQFMRSPSPGTSNGAGTPGIVGDTHFSVDRGFFTSAFNVAITTDTPGASIRYTTDGSLPTDTLGTLYTGPININQTTTLRAIAYKAGNTPSNADTETYIFLDDVIHQSVADATPGFATWGHDKEDADSASGYDLDDESDWDMDPDIVNNAAWSSTIKNDLKAVPTVSLVMDWNDLFGGAPQPGTPLGGSKVAPEPQGIYIHGRSDERAASMEYFNSTLTDQVHQDVAVEIQGHSSPLRWNTDKLSLQLKFKPPYGPGKLKHNFFGNGAASEFDTLVLDAGFNYAWTHSNSVQNSVARYVTDQVMADLQNADGGHAAHGKWVHLYLNGLYWGIYDLHERPDDTFAASYYGDSKNDYDIIKHASNDPKHYTWVEGGVTAEQNYASLVSLTRAVEASPGNTSLYSQLQSLLDVDDFIDYMIIHYYGGNSIDWSNNNWYAARNRTASGKWTFHEWDQEHAFPTNDNSDGIDQNVDITSKDEVDTPTELNRNLLANAEYKLRFADRAQKLLNNGGLLTPAVASSYYSARVTELDRAIVGESARWGDNRNPNTPFTRTNFVNTNTAVVNTFFPTRAGTLLSQFTSRGWLASLAAPVFNTGTSSTSYGGTVSQGTQLTMTKPAGSPATAVIYYTTDGSDPRLSGGAINTPIAQPYGGPIALNASQRIKARIYNPSTQAWSAIIDATYLVNGPYPLRITELHYHPPHNAAIADDEDQEFIELLNTSAATINLQGAQISQFSATPYVFGNISLGAGERIVVARNPTVFQQVYGTGINLAPAGYGTANLSNGGERVELRGPLLGDPIQAFDYDDTAPWPTSPDGDGPSLEIINPLGDEKSAANWRASYFTNGSPGTDDTPPAVTGATWRQVAVQFTQNVTPPAAGAMQINPLPSGSPITPTGVSFDSPTKTSTFATPDLPDGNYHATLTVNGVAFPLDFFVLLGDANHDRNVNILDFNAMAGNFNATGGISYAQGDFNYDGVVNALDFNAIASRWGTNLAAPGPAPLPGQTVFSVGQPTPRLFGDEPIDSAFARDLLA